ncbi:hypothetical protein LY41_002812 [Prauserella halophila]|nr:hypothetical protein [Prauserella halophila]
MADVHGCRTRARAQPRERAMRGRSGDGWAQDTRARMLNRRPGVRNTGPGVRNTGPGIRNTGPGIRNTGPGVRNTGPGVGCRLLQLRRKRTWGWPSGLVVTSALTL